jgi:hypothetical protein
MAAKNKVKAFQNALFSEDMMEAVMDWVRDNYSPDEVFDEDALTAWAEEQDLTEMMDEDALMEWATENGYVLEEDVDHETWAEENGYILEEDCECDCPECDCDD